MYNAHCPYYCMTTYSLLEVFDIVHRHHKYYKYTHIPWYTTPFSVTRHPVAQSPIILTPLTFSLVASISTQPHIQHTYMPLTSFNTSFNMFIHNTRISWHLLLYYLLSWRHTFTTGNYYKHCPNHVNNITNLFLYSSICHTNCTTNYFPHSLLYLWISANSAGDL